MAKMYKPGNIWITYNGKILGCFNGSEVKFDEMQCEPFDDEDFEPIGEEAVKNSTTISFSTEVTIEEDHDEISIIDELIWGPKLN